MERESVHMIVRDRAERSRSDADRAKMHSDAGFFATLEILPLRIHILLDLIDDVAVLRLEEVLVASLGTEVVFDFDDVLGAVEDVELGTVDDLVDGEHQRIGRQVSDMDGVFGVKFPLGGTG